jgi:hypothetical protein
MGYPIVRLTFAGVESAVSSNHGAMYPISFALDASGNLWTIDDTDPSTDVYGLYKVTSPGQVGEARTLYYTFPATIDVYSNMHTADLFGNWNSMKIYGNNLYFILYDEANYSTYQLIKFTDITGAANVSIIDTTIPTTYIINNLTVKSDTEFYLAAQILAHRLVLGLTHSDSVWSYNIIIPLHDFVNTVGGTGVYFIDIHPVKINTLGNIYLSGVVEDSKDIVKIYNEDFTELDTVIVAGIDDTIGISYYSGSTASEYTFIVCGYTSNDVYKCYPGDYYELIADNSTMAGTIIHIVSNLTDLGVANEKRVSRVYLPVEAEHAALGTFSVEPDYSVNKTIHVGGETSEPSGATSSLSFNHGGRKTWDYTNDVFDSQVEQWQDSRIDVGANGKAFRYAIRCGDMGVANPGILRIKPPMIDIQVKTKQ